jgi:spore cortex formation protein SpoVR/YcgB (stage V sporulation)
VLTQNRHIDQERVDQDINPYSYSHWVFGKKKKKKKKAKKYLLGKKTASSANDTGKTEY